MATRKARAMETSKGAYFRMIDLKIKDAEITRDEIRRELRQYINKLKSNGSGELRGIDYSKDKVLSSSKNVDFCTAVQKIDGLQLNLNRVLDEIEDLREKRKRLINIYKNDEDIEAQVFYCREILKYSQELTATQIGYSVRQVQRIEKRIREKNKL